METYVNRATKNNYHIDSASGINKVRYYIEDNVFTDKKMLFTFPNLRYRDKSGEQVFVRDLIK